MGEDVFDTWEKVSIVELEAFFGFMILMGLVKLPSFADYWKKDEVFHYSAVASRISRRRFFEIQRYLHFANNDLLALSGTPDYNKLGKVEPILDKLSERFREVYNLHRDVSIDEAMIPFKGRSTLKQYLPLKPVKRGIKVWVLADAHNGYISNLEVYKGKDGSKGEALGPNVVKKLCQNIEQR
jgi:hypothetical protein